MKIVEIRGPAASGKTTMLRARLKEAGPDARLFHSSELEHVLNMVQRKMVGLPQQSFVDEVSPALLRKIKRMAQDQPSDYTMTVVVSGGE